MKTYQGEIANNPNKCKHRFTEQLGDGHQNYLGNARRCKACGIILVDTLEGKTRIHTGVNCKVCKILPQDFYDGESVTPTFAFWWKEGLNTDDVRALLKIIDKDDEGDST